MGFLGGLFGGNKGMGFEASQANVLNPTTSAQANQTFAQSQDALARQLAFAQALQAQGGIGNQSAVFGQQQQLANQLGQQAAGQGPNPAQAALANATGQNVSQQASLMGSQRGVGGNAGLIARQAAQQGGNIQQQSVGQAALMQAQQQIAAQQALMQQQAQMAGLAGQQVGQQQNALGALNAGAQGLNAQTLGGIQGQNQSNVSNVGQANSANAGVAQQAAQKQGDIFGKVLGGAGALLGLAHGGEVPCAPSGPSSKVGQYMSRGGKVPGKAPVMGNSLTNDNVPAMLSPGEIVIPRTHAKDPKKAAAFARAIAMKSRKGK